MAKYMALLMAVITEKWCLLTVFVFSMFVCGLKHDSGLILKHIVPIKDSDEFQLVPLENVLFKVVRVESYVCIRPNRYEVIL